MVTRPGVNSNQVTLNTSQADALLACHAIINKGLSSIVDYPERGAFKNLQTASKFGPKIFQANEINKADTTQNTQDVLQKKK